MSSCRIMSEGEKLVKRPGKPGFPATVNYLSPHADSRPELPGLGNKHQAHLLNKSENLGVSAHLISPKGLHRTDSGKAKAFNTHFASVFTENDGKDLPHMDPGTHPPMEDFLFRHNQGGGGGGIERLLSKLRPNKAPGPDELPALVLKETS